MRKKVERKDNIQSVALAIYAKDGRKLEIPLEMWHVTAVCEMLGLQVDTINLDTYSMRNKEQIDEIMEMHYYAIKNLYSKNQDNTK